MYMLRIPVTDLFNETGKTNSGVLQRGKRLILENQEAYGHVLHLGEILVCQSYPPGVWLP
jgi:hypothetical protein